MTADLFEPSARPSAREPDCPCDRAGPTGHYQIRVRGVLDSQWSTWFEGLAITTDMPGQTLIAGPVTDQAALHGLPPRSATSVCRCSRSATWARTSNRREAVMHGPSSVRPQPRTLRPQRLRTTIRKPRRRPASQPGVPPPDISFRGEDRRDPASRSHSDHPTRPVSRRRRWLIARPGQAAPAPRTVASNYCYVPQLRCTCAARIVADESTVARL